MDKLEEEPHCKNSIKSPFCWIMIDGGDYSIKGGPINGITANIMNSFQKKSFNLIFLFLIFIN